MRYTPENITHLASNEIFVYGANESFIHGAGAARLAKDRFGAIMFKGPFNGQSYGICTKDFDINTLPVLKIKKYVEEFLNFAKNHPEFVFLVTKIGCGLAALSIEDIAPLFSEVPPNVVLPREFYN